MLSQTTNNSAFRFLRTFLLATLAVVLSSGIGAHAQQMQTVTGISSSQDAAGTTTLTGSVQGIGSQTQPITGSVTFMDAGGTVSYGSATLGTTSFSNGLVKVPGADLSLTGFANLVVTGDFNGDGHPDIAEVEYSQNTASLKVFLGNGDGTFASPKTTNLTLAPSQILVGDFNGDHKDDLLLLVQPSELSSSAPVALYALIGNGDGTFQPGVAYKQPAGEYQVALGDFNGDGHPDVVLANASTATVSVLLNNGDGTFSSSSPSPADAPLPAGAFVAQSKGITSIAAGDINGDHKTDLVVNDRGYIWKMLGNGDGTFQAETILTSNVTKEQTGQLLLSNLRKGESVPDIVLSSVFSTPTSIEVLLNNNDGTFQPESTYPLGSQVGAVAAVNFTGSHVDIVALDNSGSSIDYLAGNGDGTFQSVQTINSLSYAGTISAADFTGSGKQYAVTADLGNSGALSFFRQEASGVATASFSGVSYAPGVHQVVAVYSGDSNYAASTSSPLPQGVPLVQSAIQLAVPASGTALLGSSVQLTAYVSNCTPVKGDTVAFFSGTTPLGTAVPDLSTGVATLSVTNLPLGQDQITAVYSGNSLTVGSTSAAHSFNIVSFTIASAPGAGEGVAVSASQPGQYGLLLTPAGGAFVQPVSLTVSGLPSGVTATINPSTIAAGSGVTQATISFNTNTSVAAKERSGNTLLGGTAGPVAACLLFFSFIPASRKRKLAIPRMMVLGVLALASIAALGSVTGCSSGTNPIVTPPSTQYQVAVTATSASTSQSVKFLLSVQ